ncbi:MAG TPA: AAA family ATPase [Telluria sp.]|nr:AAA family ATPase [Telluria sp.]
MYQDHFGLRESPFGITPNPDFFFVGNTRGELLDALCWAVERGEGIVKVTGEVGSGKTMLCRMLEHRLAPHIDLIYLANPTLLPRELCFAIAGELGLASAGMRVDEVLRMVQADLISRHVRGRQVVLLAEEAQAMPLDTLEELRLLSNLETSRDKLLQIVLFGQPELDRHLSLPRMRQLKERITQSFSVPLMPEPAVHEFLAFRMHAAGYTGQRAFSIPAARCIAQVSRGIVRRINILADKALLAAYIDDAGRVELKHAQAAVQDSAYARFESWPQMGAALLGGMRRLTSGARHD